MTASSSTGTQAIDRAVALVATVVEADEPMTFAELHAEGGLAKSTTSRLLAALERTELLERNADGAVRRRARCSGSTPSGTTRGTSSCASPGPP